MKKKIAILVIAFSLFATGVLAAPLVPWQTNLDMYFNKKQEEFNNQDYKTNEVAKYVEQKKHEIDEYFKNKENPKTEKIKNEIDAYVDEMIKEYEATQ